VTFFPDVTRQAKRSPVDRQVAVSRKPVDLHVDTAIFDREIDDSAHRREPF
jgi:hypothetical protein